MNRIQVNGPHLMQHFVDDGPDTTGSCLEARHGVVADVGAEVDGGFKLV